MKQNLFIKITEFVHKEQLQVNVNQGYTENTVWITGLEHNIISSKEINAIMKFSVKNRIRYYFDCYDGKLVLYTM